MFQPVIKKSIATEVFEQIRQKILTAEFEPGSHLPSERKLAEMLGVNRGAIREALKRLQQAHLILIQQGGATQVLDYTEHAGTEMLTALLMRDGQVDIQTARAMMELRTGLAVDIARRCAENKPKTAKTLLKICDEMEATRDLQTRKELNYAFWRTLVDGTNNIAYALAFNTVDGLYEVLGDVVILVLEPELGDVATHRDIALAVKNKDCDTAGILARELTERGESRVKRITAWLAKK